MTPRAEELSRLLAERGPLIGAEVVAALPGESLDLWRLCRTSRDIRFHTVGRRYLRLDRRVAGYARLSPSVWREFLTYTVVGRRDDGERIEQRARALIAHTEAISRSKSELAYRIISALAGRLEALTGGPLEGCFIIAGDIVHNMAHDVPRPERSTGKMVRGSDIDLVVVLADSVPEALQARLDDAIFQEKYRFLVTPHLREEIDYVVKPMGRIREQIRFDTFRHMLACKILQEGTLLYGSAALFTEIKTLLRDQGITARLEGLERSAAGFRAQAESTLMSADRQQLREDGLHLFYPADEAEEFE